MNEQQVASLEGFLAATESDPFLIDDVWEEGIGFRFAEEIEGLAVWRDEVEKLYLYATIGAFPADHPEASRLPLQYNSFWASARSAFCALDTTGEQLLLCLALRAGEIDAETLRAASSSLVRSVGELRSALEEMKREPVEPDEDDDSGAADEVLMSV